MQFFAPPSFSNKSLLFVCLHIYQNGSLKRKDVTISIILKDVPPITALAKRCHHFHYIKTRTSHYGISEKMSPFPLYQNTYLPLRHQRKDVTISIISKHVPQITVLEKRCRRFHYIKTRSSRYGIFSNRRCYVMNINIIGYLNQRVYHRVYCTTRRLL